MRDFWADSIAVLHEHRPERATLDHLELLTALVNGPQFDPALRGEVLRIPPDHSTYRWTCQVRDCPRYGSQKASNADLCSGHLTQWKEHHKAGGSRAKFLATAKPLILLSPPGIASCRICVVRPSKGPEVQLCHRHTERWVHSFQRYGITEFDEWLERENPFAGFGECLVAHCSALAFTPLGLCRHHETVYEGEGRVGGAHLSLYWVRDYDSKNLPTPVTFTDRAAFRRWCRSAPARYVPGEVNLRGLRPLARSEIQWGLFKHTDGQRSVWSLSWIQSLVNTCRRRNVTSLLDLDLESCTQFDNLIAREMLAELRLVYFTPEQTRAAGFIETEHFGVRFPRRLSHYSLLSVSQHWLRDLLWEYLVAMLKSPKCPRTGGMFDQMRRSAVELSAFLEADAPGGGHDPTVLRESHMQRFVADQRHRARTQMPSLGLYRKDGKHTTVTQPGCVLILNSVRRLLRTTLESDLADRLGLDRGFVVAVPAGGKRVRRRRRPLADDVARAIADDANLRRLDDRDVSDNGLRDVWEVIVTTGRRCQEALGLGLDCVERLHGRPFLWHDQTKVGNYDEAIRIPEPLAHRLQQRRDKTLQRFFLKNGRYPAAAERAVMALFPTTIRNPLCTKPLSYTWFTRGFRAWVDELDVGHPVPHQARHSLATNLLRAGASLHHIRRYLGHVSEAMTEHYLHLAHSDLEDVLNRVWVAGPGAPHPGEILSAGTPDMTREQAEALALDLSRRSTPAEGGFCTFQPVVQGNACPWNLNCHHCKEFVLSGADLLYWRRKREQWMSIAERAPDDATADYLHQVFAPTARAIDGLEKALAAVGLLDEALGLDLRRPQDYFQRIWATAFRARDLAEHADDTADLDGDLSEPDEDIA